MSNNPTPTSPAGGASRAPRQPASQPSPSTTVFPAPATTTWTPPVTPNSGQPVARTGPSVPRRIGGWVMGLVWHRRGNAVKAVLVTGLIAGLLGTIVGWAFLPVLPWRQTPGPVTTVTAPAPTTSAPSTSTTTTTSAPSTSTTTTTSAPSTSTTTTTSAPAPVGPNVLVVNHPKTWADIQLTPAFTTWLDANKALTGFSSSDVAQWSKATKWSDGSAVSDERIVLVARTTNLTEAQALAKVGLSGAAVVKADGDITIPGSGIVTLDAGDAVVAIPALVASGSGVAFDPTRVLMLASDGLTATPATLKRAS